MQMSENVIHQIDNKTEWLLCSVILRPNLSSQWKFQTFSIPELWNKFSGKWNPNSKKWSTTFKLKPLRLKTHHFHWKLLCQKPMLRQIEWRLLNGPIIKSEVLPVSTLFFLENLFQFWNLLKRVNLMYQRLKCAYLYFS